MALGAKKGKFVYTDDAGDNWVIAIAEDRVTGVTPSTGLTAFNPTSPPSNFKGRLNPKRCRRVYAEFGTGTEILRRQFICTIGSALYATTVSQNVSYTPEGSGTDITMHTTGRRGEKLTF